MYKQQKKKKGLNVGGDNDKPYLYLPPIEQKTFETLNLLFTFILFFFAIVLVIVVVKKKFF